MDEDIQVELIRLPNGDRRGIKWMEESPGHFMVLDFGEFDCVIIVKNRPKGKAIGILGPKV